MTLPGPWSGNVDASLTTALELCRGLLAYSAPGTPVSVPHAALAELIDLASVTGSARINESTLETAAADPEPLQTLYDVAALGLRYNRAKPTIREWFRDGLFGPPEERRFRGREYVATDDAVREFERSTGLRPAAGQPVLLDSDEAAGTNSTRATSVPPSAPPPRKKRKTDHRSPAAMKILAAQGGSSRRQYR